MRKLYLLPIFSIIIASLSGCGMTSTNPGEAVVFSRFGEVDPKCYPAGFYIYNPITTNAWHIDTKVQKFQIQTEAASKDLQNVHLTVVLNFSVNAQNCAAIVAKVGVDFKDRIIKPALEEVSKAATARFAAEKVIQDRPMLKDMIEKEITARLISFNINIQAVSLTNISFDPAYSKAIEAKQIEEQNVQKAEYARQQGVKEGERVLAIAEGQAKANKIIAASIQQSPEIIQYNAIEKWDGKLPEIVAGETMPFINIKGKR